MRRNTLLIGTLVVAALVVGAGVTAAIVPGGAAAPSPDGRTVTVQASGTASASPDRARVRLSVVATADDASTARARLAENTSQVRSALTDLGLSDDQVRTVDYDLRRVREPKRPERTTRTAAGDYRARHALLVEVHDLDRVGSVVDAAVEAGANRVDGVAYTLSPEQRRTLERRALTEAMENAHGKASALAGASDLALGDVYSATTHGGSRPRRYVAAAGGAAGGNTNLESGPVSVTVRVSAVYNATAA